MTGAHVGVLASARMSSGYMAEVLADSPSFYWRLGESGGTTAADDSGNAWDGTYVNTPTLGVVGAVSSDSAITLNGSSQYVSLNRTDLYSSSTGFTFECWFKASSTAAVNMLIGQVSTGTAEIMRVGLNYSGSADALRAGGIGLMRRGSNNTFSRANTVATTGYVDGNWHHLVVAIPSTSSTVATFYVDGASVSVQDTTSDSTAATWDANDYGFAVGADNVRSVIGRYLNGSLDEVAWYKSVLSSTRVAAHYAARNT